MPQRPLFRSWQQISPNTIPAWLVSDDPNDEQRAAESLEQMGAAFANDWASENENEAWKDL